MKYFFTTLLFIFSTCVWELSPIPELTIRFEELDPNSVELSEQSRDRMNGTYKVINGKGILGERVAGKWIKNRWCLFAESDVVYSENVGGIIGGYIKMVGYVRIVRSGTGSHLNLSILPDEGAIEIINDQPISKIIIRGITKDGEQIALERISGLNDSPYFVLAHRGGGRNSERLGFSENSIEMIKHSEILGANGVEIDVMPTRDHQLILFHDKTFSPRTVTGTYLLGNVENFDLSHIKKFGQLIYGESIPTLSEALNTIIDSASLSLVWLDVKDPNSVDDIIKVQKNAIDKAKALNRNILILLGIPSKEVLQKYRASEYANTTDVLVELDIETALDLETCRAWAPRWTNNIPEADINRAKNKNLLVFTWTLDVEDYIRDFIYNKKFDGILSNYPSLLSGIHLCKEE